MNGKAQGDPLCVLHPDVFEVIRVVGVVDVVVLGSDDEQYWSQFPHV